MLVVPFCHKVLLLLFFAENAVSRTVLIPLYRSLCPTSLRFKFTLHVAPSSYGVRPKFELFEALSIFNCFPLISGYEIHVLWSRLIG